MEELKAKTSEVPYYSKIDYRFLDRMAVALTAGSNRCDPHVLVENWRLGNVEFYYKRANNGIRHIFKWLHGDRTEDHLAHAACNLMMLMWGEEQGIYNPLPPEIRTLQYINFVRSTQAAKNDVDPPPGVSTKESLQRESTGEDTAIEQNDEDNDAVDTPEDIPTDLVNDVGISHVDITGKPVFVLPEVDIQKLKKKLLG